MSASNFERALREVLRHEGGYSNHPADPGGATNMGITHKTLAQWRGRSVSKTDVKDLSVEEAFAIYRARYWNTILGDDMPPGLDLALFDYAVNSGPARAIKALQQVLEIARDGKITPAMMRAIAARDGLDLALALCAERQRFLERLPTFPVFGRGWTRRVEAIRVQVRLMATMDAGQRVAPSVLHTQPQEKTTMELTKSFITSKTVWANIIGFGALVLSVFGFNTAGIDPNVFADHILQIIAAGSFVLSTVFRVVATKRIL